MIVKVRMAVWHEGAIREVNIPDETPSDEVLAEAFHWGQNDFQPNPDLCSVSVGDVIEYGDVLHLVLPVGFVEISEGDYDTLMALPRRDRVFKVYDFQK